jgi:hypothetical protein
MNLKSEAKKFGNKLTHSGGVDKLEMKSFTDDTFSEEIKGSSFKVPFNPTSLNLKLEIGRAESTTMGATQAPVKFVATPSQDFGFEFIIDATGFEGGKQAIANANQTVDGKHTYVQTSINDLKKVVSQVNGDIHQPNYVKILYGPISLNCVLNSLDITYTLFDRSGNPLRAKINISFKTIINKKEDAIKTDLKSPDLTKIRELKQHDHFLNVSNKMYDDNLLYVQVARANNMNSIRENKTGKRIVFPPIIEQENSTI